MPCVIHSQPICSKRGWIFALFRSFLVMRIWKRHRSIFTSCRSPEPLVLVLVFVITMAFA